MQTSKFTHNCSNKKAMNSKKVKLNGHFTQKRTQQSKITKTKFLKKVTQKN